jgi:hypothetical protein
MGLADAQRDRCRSLWLLAHIPREMTDGQQRKVTGATGSTGVTRPIAQYGGVFGLTLRRTGPTRLRRPFRVVLGMETRHLRVLRVNVLGHGMAALSGHCSNGRRSGPLWQPPWQQVTMSEPLQRL